MKFGDWVSGTEKCGYFISGIVCGNMVGDRTRILVCNYPSFSDFIEDDLLKVHHEGHEKSARKLRRKFLKEFPNILDKLK